MRKVMGGAAATLAVGLVTACASAGGPGVGSLSWNVGEATANDAQQKTVEVLRKHFYDIERQEGPPSIYIITRWRTRVPFDDERELGVVEARTRFIVEARRGSQQLFTVRLRAENEGRTDQDFRPVETTPEFREYTTEVSSELRTVLLMGIRGSG